MTRRRWIADEVSGDRAALTGSHAEHLIRVLRARVGQEFDIAAGDAVYRGRIALIGDHRVEFELGERVSAPEQIELTLILAIIKFDRMEWAIEKCTELGVAKIVPLIANRTDVHLAAAALKRAERWRRIAREAAEQSRRSAPPDISQPLRAKEAAALPGNTRILLAEFETQTTLRDAVQSHRGHDLLLAVGPEGGWTEEEGQLFRTAGWIAASLGQTILRAETAAIAATAIVMAELQ